MGGGIEGLLCINDNVSLTSLNLSTVETSSNDDAVGWTCPSSEPRLLWQVISTMDVSWFVDGDERFPLLIGDARLAASAGIAGLPESLMWDSG